MTFFSDVRSSGHLGTRCDLGCSLFRYTEKLQPARRSGIIRSALTGASGGITFIIMYAVYGIGFW